MEGVTVRRGAAAVLLHSQILEIVGLFAVPAPVRMTRFTLTGSHQLSQNDLCLTWLSWPQLSATPVTTALGTTDGLGVGVGDGDAVVGFWTPVQSTAIPPVTASGYVNVVRAVPEPETVTEAVLDDMLAITCPTP